MSEYQYYEFLAVDRPLDGRQQAELRALSTRADIIATGLVNEYHYGGFRGDPRSTSTPRNGTAPAIRSSRGGTAVMCSIDLCSADESGERDWDGTNPARLGSLISIRADAAAGDHRALCIAWLLAAQSELDDDEIEPPVPPGLATLTGPLRELVDFLHIDRDLVWSPRGPAIRVPRTVRRPR